MQRIRRIPRICYSSCKGTIVKLKTGSKYDPAIFTVSVLLCILSVFMICYWRLPATAVECTSKCEYYHPNTTNDLVSIEKQCTRVCVFKKSKEESMYGLPQVSFSRMLLLMFTITVFVLLNIRKSMKLQICLGSPERITWQSALFRQLPLKTVTMIVGTLFSYKFPYPLNIFSVCCFAKVTKVDISEAVNDSLTDYETILALFNRRLKEGLRPINKHFNVVSPVDGRVMYVGEVASHRTVHQVKGVSYSLGTFAGRGVIPTHYREGYSLYTAVVYLSPGDYHHFHSPADWSADLCRHFKGDLLSVSPWFVKHIPGLFALNERVWLSGHWEHGFFSMTAVGALNVGSIHIDFCKDLVTNVDDNHRPYVPYSDFRLPLACELTKGEHVGRFSFGSTVVLLFEAPCDFRFVVSAGDSMKYGQALGTCQ